MAAHVHDSFVQWRPERRVTTTDRAAGRSGSGVGSRAGCRRRCPMAHR